MQGIETARLFMRELTVDDAAFVLELLNEPAYMRFIADRGVRTLEEARVYLLDRPLASYEKYGFGLYAVVLKETDAPIGMCGLIKRDALDDVDIGYAFLERYWGKGYAPEAARAVIDYGLHALGLKRIIAYTSLDNDRSIRVLEKLGFRYEKTITLPGYIGDSKLFVLPD